MDLIIRVNADAWDALDTDPHEVAEAIVDAFNYDQVANGRPLVKFVGAEWLSNPAEVAALVDTVD